MRNSSVERTWTVSDSKWICVEGGLCVILSFERFIFFPTHNCASMCVIHRVMCVVYASSMRDYVRDTRRPSVLMRRNWFETAHVHVRPLTPHVHITYEPRMYNVHSTDNHLQNLLVRWTFAKSACFDGFRQWSMRWACVRCSWNTAPYLLVCVDVRDMSVIRRWW
jgi:hypothetical protein